MKTAGEALFSERCLRVALGGGARRTLLLDGRCESGRVRSSGARGLPAPSPGDLARLEAEARAGLELLRSHGLRPIEVAALERRIVVETPRARHERVERRVEWLGEAAGRRLGGVMARVADGLDPLRLLAPQGALERPLRAPLLLAPQAAGVLFHELLGHALEETDLGTVLRPGERIGGAELRVWDRPELPGRGGSLAVDDEGVPARPLLLVERGMVRATLPFAGRARRASFRDPALARMTNLVIEAGTTPAAELAAAAGCRIALAAAGAPDAGGRRARLALPWVERDGVRLGPAELRVELAALASCRLGREAPGEAFALCGRDGQDLWVSQQAPALLLEGEVLPA